MFITDRELPDGLGGQIDRKLTAYAYAKASGNEYFHRPITDIMWHPGDCFDLNNDKQKQKFINELNSFFTYKNPQNVTEADAKVTTVKGIREVSLYTRGMLKKFPMKKQIVVHVRRGNIVADQSQNPRYISDGAYKKLFIHLETIIKDFRLQDHEIIILTDGPINTAKYIDTPEHEFWRNQTGMNVDGEVTKLEPFNTSILNPNLKYTILNDICSLDALKIMLSASWLISGTSAFSKIAAIGGHYNAIGNTRNVDTKSLRGSWVDVGDDVKITIGHKIYE